MSGYSEIEKTIMNTHSLFWNALANRDLDTRFSVCSDDVTFIGTGLQERAINKAEYKKINQIGIEQFPDKFKIDFLWTNFALNGDTAWVECEVTWTQNIEDKITKEQVRNTTIFKQENNKWWIVHVHGSSPDYRLQQGDYMTNSITAKKNAELERLVYERTNALNKTLQDLKSAQAQLIQSEKMASLGQLTAGIAHEIQNPLNFVNNFSEVSRELIEELKSQKSKLKSEEQDEILDDIDANLEKINHHGKRADSIVKGMLQHSQKSTSKKELTDMNVLADEYLRLSYHGFRAIDNYFNVAIKTDFDGSLDKINIIPQDIGRALLNIYNNAFYAVNEKRKMNVDGYEPVISITTKKVNDTVEIHVKDNGNGVPLNIKDKIFQPFFTTKPTGQGTGLGLSLSYDIIKAHGGEINIETKGSDGSEFIIQLPLV